MPHLSQRLAGTLAVMLSLAGCAGQSGKPTVGSSVPDVIEQSTLSAAQAAEASYDYQSASGSWGNLYARHPDDAGLALHYARSLRYSGQTQSAIDLILGFMDKHGRQPAMMVELGKEYLAADRLGLAVRTLREAADMAPKDWEAKSALGVALDYQGDYAEAQKAYAQALVLAPDNPVALNNLGLSQAQAGLLDQARATLEKAADQPRASAQVRQNLALIKALSGDIPGAERLNRQDLTAEMVRANGAYYRQLNGGKIN